MTTFALVHGAWHGAWCWERLIPELEQHGHAAIAIDLPCDDRDGGVRAYAEAVLAGTAGAGVIDPAWSRTAAPERLGSDAVEVPGGHSPFLCRPAELAEALVSVGL